MTTLSRRQLILSAAASNILRAAPLGLPIGCQVYPVRKMLGQDFDGTLKTLAAAGFKSIEMCSPQGYQGDFAPLASLPAAELKRRINDAGLTCDSSHYTMREFRESLGERIEYAKALGLKQMIMSSFAAGKNPTMADWVRVAGEFNKMAEQVHKAGLQAGFHNHDIEFSKLDGELVYDKLLSELDPKLVKMQFQVVVVRLGFDPPTIFAKHPGRFISLHLQDWSPEEKKMVPIGKGQVDWKKLFGAAKKAGVKNYYVEMDLEQMKASVPFLKDLKA